MRELVDGRRTLSLACDNTRALYLRLLREGKLAAPAETLDRATVPARAVARCSADYLLRLIETGVAEFSDILNGLIWLEVLRSSHEHLPPAVGIDVAESRPVRLATVAKRIATPPETVRRRAAALAERGLLQVREGGVLLSDDTTARPDVLRFCNRNQRDLRRMFAALDRLGVAASWRSAGRGGDAQSGTFAETAQAASW